LLVVQGAHKGRPYAMSFFVGATLVVALQQDTPVRFIHQGRPSGRYRTRNDGDGLRTVWSELYSAAALATIPACPVVTTTLMASSTRSRA